MKTPQLFTLVTFVALFAGCATVTPKELVNARSAYQTASEGPAQQLVPAELHKAHEALNQAEQSFQKDPDSSKTKDLAYIAQRKSEQAGALGSMAAAKASKDRANDDFQKKQSEIVQQGKQDLSDSEKRAADKQAELEKQTAVKAAETQAALEKQAAIHATATQAELEKQAAVKAANDKAAADLQVQQAAVLQGQQNLKDSEKRTADAVAALASLASLKEEERGLVVTLSGGVLFRSAESTLMPSARVKLDQVANALLAIRARNLIVEGHTDSRGTDAYNRNLSQRRADAVRDYLVQRGYPADHIQSRGQGEGSPIANNASAEGRANNRRVEIVVEREVKSSKQ
jgi:outer membrane protein OmpA-like peptidoglycan-associated protein